MIDNHHVVRPYTPINSLGAAGRIDLLVKVYPQGKMSQHLSKLQIGDQVEMMGPIGHFQYDKSKYQRIGLIGAGTGITPLFQVIQSVLYTEATKITLLYANNTEQDILLKDQLLAWQSQFPDRFHIEFVLLEPPENSNYHKGFITSSLVHRFLATSEFIGICGPPGMEQACAQMVKNMAAPPDCQTFTLMGLGGIPPATPPPKTQLPRIPLSEVAKHKEERDCWMVIQDGVYDVTKFVGEHPGGFIILDGGGVDATAMFYDDFPHSDEAIHLLEQYRIGNVDK